MSQIKKIIHGTSIVVLSNFLIMGIGYLLKLFLARTFSVEEFGLIFGVIAFFNFFHLFYYLGLNNSLVKFVSSYMAKRNFQKAKASLFSAMFIQFLITLPISVLIFVFKQNIALSLFKTKEAEILITFGVIYLFLSPLVLIKEYLRGLQKIKLCSLFDISQNLFHLIMSFILFHILSKKFQLSVVIISYVLFYILVLLYFFIYLVMKKISFFKLLDLNLSKKMLKFGLPLVLSAALGSFFGKIDVILITYFRNLTEVGYYNAAIPTVSAVYGILGAFNLIFYPVIASMWAKNEEKNLIDIVNILIKYILLISIPLTFIIIWHSKLIINLLFGSNFEGAYLAMIIYAPMIILGPLNKILTPILMSASKTKIIAKNSIIVVIIDFIGNLILINLFGINGAVFTSVFAFFILVILNFFQINKIISIEIPYKKTITILFSSSILLITIIVIKEYLKLSPLIEIGISLFSSSLIYIILLFAFKVITFDEILKLMKIKSKYNP